MKQKHSVTIGDQKIVSKRPDDHSRQHAWREPATLCALFSALAAFGSCAVAGFQYTQNARETAVDRRPWVTVNKPRLESLAPGKISTLSFDVQNVGRTPAEGVQTASIRAAANGSAAMSEDQWMELGHRLLLEGVASLKFEPGPSIAPSATQSVRTHEHDPTTQEEFDRIGRGEERLFFFGEIRYADAEGHTDSTKFCAFARGSSTESTLTTLNCPFWNDLQ
jgi:hypothetical protein